jgi:hypothetical protein
MFHPLRRKKEKGSKTAASNAHAITQDPHDRAATTNAIMIVVSQPPIFRPCGTIVCDWSKLAAMKGCGAALSSLGPRLSNAGVTL